MNKKGLSIIELIVTLALVSTVVVMMLQLLVDIKYEDIESKNRTSNYMTQAILIKDIQNKLLRDTITKVTFDRTSPIFYFYGTTGTHILKFEETTDANGNIQYFATFDNEKREFKGKIQINRIGITCFSKEVKHQIYFRFKIPIEDANRSYDIEIFHIVDKKGFTTPISGCITE